MWISSIDPLRTTFPHTREWRRLNNLLSHCPHPPLPQDYLLHTEYISFLGHINMDDPSCLIFSLLFLSTPLFLTILVSFALHLESERSRLRTKGRIRSLEDKVLLLALAIHGLKALIESHRGSSSTTLPAEPRTNSNDADTLARHVDIQAHPNHITQTTDPPLTNPFLSGSSSSRSSRSSLFSGRTLTSAPNLSGDTLVQSSSDNEDNTLRHGRYVASAQPVVFNSDDRHGLTVADEVQLQELEAELRVREEVWEDESEDADGLR
jgi:hypothetical protein